MRSLIALLASAGTATVGFGCSMLGVRSGYESPPYDVIDSLRSDLEVRRYGPRVAIETEVEAPDPSEGRNQAFRILAAYIFGENEARQEIAMTAPVETRASSEEIAMTVPVETHAAGGRVRMRFFAPSEYGIDALPKPKDPRVRFVEAPGETLAVLRFSGLGGERAIAEHEAELLESLAGSSWSAAGDPITLFYDPPWTLPFLRRNETGVRVVPAAPGARVPTPPAAHDRADIQ